MILGDGTQSKQYVYVYDLIDAIVKFMNTEKSGVTLYNLGAEGQTSVTRIADVVCEKMGLQGISYNYTGGKIGWKGDVPRFRYDLTKIHAAGWQAVYSSDEAVVRTVEEVLRCRQ